MKNWKTSVAGILAAIGLALSANSNPTIKLIGEVVSIVGTVLFALAAKDGNVTGGSVPQATPPGVDAISNQMGVQEDLTAKSYGGGSQK